MKKIKLNERENAFLISALRDWESGECEVLDDKDWNTLLDKLDSLFQIDWS